MGFHFPARIQGVNGQALTERAGKLNNRRENAKVILFMIDLTIVYAAEFAL